MTPLDLAPAGIAFAPHRPTPNPRGVTMIRSILGAILVGVCNLLPAVASAVPPPPDPNNSTVPAFIRVGGAQTLAGVPDPSIAFTITVRDNLNNPIAGSAVEVDFSNCSDTRLCTAVIAGQVVDCPNKRVLAVANAFGQVTLSILGASINAGRPPQDGTFPGAGLDCVHVRADGFLLRTATSVDYDQNGGLPGGNGVAAADLQYSLNDVRSVGLRRGFYRGRTDYSVDGKLSALDLYYHFRIIGNSGMGIGSGAGCAGGGTVQPYCP